MVYIYIKTLVHSLALSVALSLIAGLAGVYAQDEVFKRQNTETICNGYSQLCGRSVGNITFAGAHDSFAFDTNISIASDEDYSATQIVNLTAQLNLGIRAFEGQVHLDANTGFARFCHTLCGLFNGSSVLDYLIELNTWLGENPNDFVILFIANGDHLKLAGTTPDTYQYAFDQSGIVSKTLVLSQIQDPSTGQPFSPPIPRSSWPALGSILGMGKQLLVFMDSCATVGDCDTLANETLPYINPEFESVVEDPYDQLTVNGVFNCTPDRFTGPLSIPDHMNMANHFRDSALVADILIPDIKDIETTNSVESILTHANNCSQVYNSWPNVVLIDFSNIGNVIQAGLILNGLAPYSLDSTNSSTASTSMSPSASVSAKSTMTTSAGTANTLTSSSDGRHQILSHAMKCLTVCVTLGVSLLMYQQRDSRVLFPGRFS